MAVIHTYLFVLELTEIAVRQIWENRWTSLQIIYASAFQFIQKILGLECLSKEIPSGSSEQELTIPYLRNPTQQPLEKSDSTADSTGSIYL